MLTLKQRQERAARRAARIAAKHEAIRAAACTDNERSAVMKKNEVKVGSTYLAKVSDKVVPVRIDQENPHGGWDATNLATKKAVRIKSAQRLRAEAGRKAAPTAQVGIGAKPAAESAKDTKAASAAAGGESTNPLEAHYRAQKDAAKVAGDARKTKKATVAKPKAARKPGILTLAADVLRDAKAPMDCKAIVEKVLAKGLWHTKGKTPAATLYAAIIREIAAKGKETRFHKTDRGMFELSATGK
jgi:hypothetical protein